MFYFCENCILIGKLLFEKSQGVGGDSVLWRLFIPALFSGYY